LKPEVGAASRRLPTTLRVLLLLGASVFSACGGGSGGGGAPDDGTVTISGLARYESPPPALNCNGLDFDDIPLVPIRQATIQAIDAATDAVLDEARTGDSGDYSLTVDADTRLYLRVRAELKRTGDPSWDVEVRDNVTSAANPLPLGQRPLYVLEGSAFDSGSSDLARDITATTGWGGMSYTATRSAAPFAVLDAVYSAMLLILAENPQGAFEPLDVFWSINNTATVGAERDIDAGELGTSFYNGDSSLFLLGKDGVDTEEFDGHVIAHEWGHYFEDTMSRSDSIGGTHAIGDLLDMRVAFGEGFATAFSGMALDSPDYCDTLGPAQGNGFLIDIEEQAGGTPGWFNETSVMKFVYDLWDTDVDNADTDSIGFGPIHSVMTAAQSDTPAFTSIFSFAEALKQQSPAAVPLIDALLEAENITAAGINAYGEGEVNDGEPGALDVLPIYTTVVPDGSTINICSNGQFDPNVDGNKLSEHRFLRMTVDTPARYLFEIVTTTAMPAPDDPEDSSDQSDPDILIVLNGQVQNVEVAGDLEGFSGVANAEIFTTANPLAGGDYVMTLVEFRYRDEESPANYPPQTCFDVSIAPAS
jgi:hypothetical protein